jgi:hypothetical protein
MYNKLSYNKLNYNKLGYNKLGYKKLGYNKPNYKKLGYKKPDYNKLGYNKLGHPIPFFIHVQYLNQAGSYSKRCLNFFSIYDNQNLLIISFKNYL